MLSAAHKKYLSISMAIMQPFLLKTAYLYIETTAMNASAKRKC